MNPAPKIGLWVAMIIATFVISAFSALLYHAPNGDLLSLWQDPYYRHVTQFSFYQASLSTLFSIVLAIPVAHALSRRHFWGKALILRLFSTTLVLPVLVGVFGILAIYGNSGLIAQGLQHFNHTLPFSLYGLNGILLAHVFFNLPYASRLLLQSLEGISVEQHKLCAHLGMSAWDKFRWVEWPRLRQQLPAVCGLVFMLCFTSFATVMALGGGPKATTIELAIYQAIKFDFDLQGGAVLALWQMLLCGVLTISLQRLAKPVAITQGSITHRVHFIRDSRLLKLWDSSWIIASCLLVLPPLLMVVIAGLNSHTLVVLQDPRFWNALITSFKVASFAGSLALLAGIGIILTSRAWRIQHRNRRADKLELIGTIILLTPGLVISTGTFLLLRSMTDAFSLAFFVVILVNSLMALPYVIKSLAQPMLHQAQQYHYLCSSLGIRGFNRLRLIEWRSLTKPFAMAFSLSFILSLGDLSAVALFGGEGFRTLPLYLFQLLGSYQMDAAAVVSLTLLVLSLSCFKVVDWVFNRLSKRHLC